MALRDTVGWITDTHAIVVSKQRVTEEVAVNVGYADITPPTYQRPREIVTSKWVNLTYSVASTYADCHWDTNTHFNIEPENLILGAYTLIRTVDSKGAWT